MNGIFFQLLYTFKHILIENVEFYESFTSIKRSAESVG